MKLYEFKITVRTPMPVKDIIWAFSHKLKDAFPVVGIDFKEVTDRPTTVEHHGGDLDNLDGKEYKDIPKRF